MIEFYLAANLTLQCISPGNFFIAPEYNFVFKPAEGGSFVVLKKMYRQRDAISFITIKPGGLHVLKSSGRRVSTRIIHNDKVAVDTTRVYRNHDIHGMCNQVVKWQPANL